MKRILLGTALAFLASTVNAEPNPGHYLLTGNYRNLNDIKKPLSVMPAATGVQVMFVWKDIERKKPGNYHFKSLDDAFNYLKARNKHFMVKIQPTCFGKGCKPATPDYMWSDPKYGCDGKDGDQYASTYDTERRRWCWFNPQLQERFLGLMEAIGNRYRREPLFEGFMFPETSAGCRTRVNGKKESLPGCRNEAWRKLFIDGPANLKKKFPKAMVFVAYNWGPFSRSIDKEIEEAAKRGVSISDTDVIFGTKQGAKVRKAMRETGKKYCAHNGPNLQWASFAKNKKPKGDQYLTDAIARVALGEVPNLQYLFWQKGHKEWRKGIKHTMKAYPLPRIALPGRGC